MADARAGMPMADKGTLYTLSGPYQNSREAVQTLHKHCALGMTALHLRARGEAFQTLDKYVHLA